MTKNLRFLIAFVAVVALLSSCKKTAVTDVSILAGHKWNITGNVTTYSDSVGVSHNNLNSCQTGYTEFHDYSTNNPYYSSGNQAYRLMYSYNTSTCPGFSSPSVTVNSWDIDNDNTNLYLYADPVTGQYGTWFTISSLNSSSFVLTTVSSQYATYNQQTNQPIYHQVTNTITFTAM